MRASIACLALVVVVAACPRGGEGEAEAGEGEGGDAEGESEGEGEGEAEDGGEGEGEGGDGEGESAGEGEGEGSVCGDGVVVGCTAAGDDFDCTIEHDGQTRSYILHVPPTYAARPAGGAPLVLSFHGLRTSAGLQRYLSGMNEESDRDGFVLVYPSGVDQSWNAGTCCGTATAQNVDDVGFSRAIIEQIAETLCIDRSRIYATGLSNGGNMSYRLACETADVFAAVASVAGVTTTSTPCQPARPVPVLQFHGTADNIVFYDTGIDGVHGAEEVVDDWASRNGCSSESTVTYQQGEVTCRARVGCAGGSAAELCTIDGGGHQWPGGNDIPLLGHNTDDVDASARIADFFAAHAR